MAGNENKWKLETTDSVSTVSSGIKPVSLMRIVCKTTDE